MNVALYVRVSTQEQALHGLSLADQQASLERWAQENRHNVVGLYADEGISARKPASKRPALQRLLDDVRDCKVELIVFTKLDRWCRNVSSYYKVQEVLDAHGVNWKTIYEDYDTSTASGRLKINIMLSVAQDEADRTSERIKIINAHKREKLEALTGKCPLGYKIEKRKVIKDPEAEQVVNAIFARYAESGSLYDVIQYISLKYGFHLDRQRLDRMLRNPAYCGRFFDADGMCPQYITGQQYERIQRMRHRIVRKSTKNNVYLFTGLTVCGECGRAMGWATQGSPDHGAYCRCEYRARSGQCHNNRTPGEKRIEAFLLGDIEQRMNAIKVADVSVVEEERKNRKNEITALKARLKRLKDLYLDGDLTLDEYRADKARMEDRMKELDVPEETPDLSAIEAVLSTGWREAYKSIARENKRGFWRILVREIRCYADNRIEYDLNV